MTDELNEILEMAKYKEIAAEALYTGAQQKTQDPGARALLEELAGQEHYHAQMVQKLRDEKLYEKGWRRESVPNLKISEYLTGTDISEGAGLQDVFIFAIKREEQAVQFYSSLLGTVQGETAKRLCQGLANEELSHKLKLELLYDRLFYQEN